MILQDIDRAVADARASTLADCTVVIPTYNERENIGALIPQVLELPRFRVLVVDDSSPDGTAEVVAGSRARRPARRAAVAAK